MTMIKHKDSHLDHGLTPAQVEYIFERFAKRDGFFVETFELPERLGTVPCNLYGPTMGDAPVLAAYRVRRGNRLTATPTITAPVRQTRKVTVVAGPHDGEPCVLFTAYGGPAAPQEPDDPSNKRSNEAAKFWSEHALAASGFAPSPFIFSVRVGVYAYASHGWDSARNANVIVERDGRKLHVCTYSIVAIDEDEAEDMAKRYALAAFERGGQKPNHDTIVILKVTPIGLVHEDQSFLSGEIEGER